MTADGHGPQDDEERPDEQHRPSVPNEPPDDATVVSRRPAATSPGDGGNEASEGDAREEPTGAPTEGAGDAGVDRTVISTRRAGAQGLDDDEDPTVIASRFAAPAADTPDPLVVRAPRRGAPEPDVTLPGSRRARLRDDRVAGRRRVITPPPSLTLHTEPAATTPSAPPASVMDAPQGPPAPGSAEARALEARPDGTEIRSVSKRSRRGARATIAVLVVVSILSALGLAAIGAAVALVLG
ncbi:hypothetical protein [Demequina sp. NBRC 110054]|uniref:hypothetical protein n=1 Tax=Demequina sp. NBRC 110054 TaxID=1570343 RepID=UPI000A055573|nr:hypothetical protein [Demequina sp. NBRC 110054]